MKKIILISVFLALFFSVNAQRFDGGIVLGVSGSQIDGDLYSGYSKAGLIAGAFVEARFNEQSALKLGAHYIAKGAKKMEKTPDYSVLINRTHLNYIELPFLYQYSLDNNQFSFEAGLLAAYLISGKREDISGLMPDDQLTFLDYDFGIMLGMNYEFSERLYMNFRFSYSISPVDVNPNQFNNVIGISFNYKLAQ